MYRQLLIGLILLLTFTCEVVAQEVLLPPDQAFLISADPLKDGGVQVRWKIADGYYLYKSKFRFYSDTYGITTGEPNLPAGVIYRDPLFGDIEVYRGDLAIRVPLRQSKLDAQVMTLKVRSQGCADAGICYPVHTQIVLVALSEDADKPTPMDASKIEDLEIPEGTSITEQEGISIPEQEESLIPEMDKANTIEPLSELSAFGGLLGLDEDSILPPEEAYIFTADVEDGNRLRLHWDIADGTYLYQDKIKLSLSEGDVSLGEFTLPEAKIKHDSVRPDGTVGDVAAYYHGIDLDIPLLRTNPEATQVTLTTKYQGCADRGICYPPITKTQLLSLPAVGDSETASSEQVNAARIANQQATQAPSIDSEPLAEHDQIASMLANSSYWIIIGSFFVIGLLLAFTPCVFPMIPILSGIIAGQGSMISTRKAFTLSVVYVLAMAMTYTAAGVVAGIFGANLQAAFQNPWILSLFALVFVLLSLSMFGFYELQLPSSLQQRLTQLSNNQEGGTLIGTAIMGLLSALIIGPCVAPPLAGALIYIGQTGDAVLGGLALFSMSMGMGAPLIAIGTSAGKLLPKAGGWMDAIKAVFGVMMLAVAIYLLERIVPEMVAMLLWGVLLIASAIYMGALRELPIEAGGWSKLWKGLGVALLIYGSLFLVGVAANTKDTLQPLRGLALGSGAAGQVQHLAFKRIKTNADLDRELAAAKAAGRPVMFDFYADWCVYCKEMEKNTFPDPRVQATLSRFVLLQADVTAQDDEDKALQTRMGVTAPPAMIFWDGKGEERRNLRLLGYMGPDDFAKHISGLN